MPVVHRPMVRLRQVPPTYVGTRKLQGFVIVGMGILPNISNEHLENVVREHHGTAKHIKIGQARGNVFVGIYYEKAHKLIPACADALRILLSDPTEENIFYSTVDRAVAGRETGRAGQTIWETILSNFLDYPELIEVIRTDGTYCLERKGRQVYAERPVGGTFLERLEEFLQRLHAIRFDIPPEKKRKR